MRILQLVLGSLLLADGLKDLIGGKKLVRQIDSRLSPRLGKGVGRILGGFADADSSVISTWGVSNTLAGIVMILSSATCRRGES